MVEVLKIKNQILFPILMIYILHYIYYIFNYLFPTANRILLITDPVIIIIIS